MKPILATRTRNPAYWYLKNKIILEQVFFASKRDLYSWMWTLLGSAFVKHKIDSDLKKAHVELETQFKSLQKRRFKGLTSQLVLAYLLYRVVKIKVGDDSFKRDFKNIEQLLLEVIKRKMFNSLEFISESLFLLSGLSDLAGVEKFKGEAEKALDRNLNDVISLSNYIFGLGSDVIDDAVTAALKESLDDLSLEQTSKILAVVSPEMDFNFLIRRHEELLHDSIEQWRVPDLEFSLIESLSLLSTSLDVNDAKRLLVALKESNVEWAKRIDDIGDKLVITSLPSLTRVPRFEPKIDTLSLLIMTKFNLVDMYQVSPVELKQANRALLTQKEDFDSFHSREAKILYGFSLILLLSAFLLATKVNFFQVLILWSKVILLVFGLLTQLVNRDEIGLVFSDLSLWHWFSLIWLFVFFTYVSYWNTWYKRTRFGDKWIDSLPLVGWLWRKIKVIFGMIPHED